LIKIIYQASKIKTGSKSKAPEMYKRFKEEGPELAKKYKKGLISTEEFKSWIDSTMLKPATKK
jgi:hypothetical protein